MKFKKYINEDEYIHILTDWGVNNYFDNILESLDKETPIKITDNTSKYFTTTFSVNDIKYVFASKIIDDVAIVMFHPVDMELDLFKERKDKKYIGSVFANIFKSLKMMLNDNIIEIAFTAEYKELEKLYKIMNPTILKRFPDWKMNKVFRNKQGKMQYSYTRK